MKRKMLLDDVSACSRPIIFESTPIADEDEGIGEHDFAYFVGGTAFICTWRSRPFVVTARHCVEEVRGDQVLIFASTDHRGSLPFSRVWKGAESSFEDFADLAVFEVACGLEDEPLRGISLPELRGYTAPRLAADERLMVSGYPLEKRAVDYQERRLPEQRYRLEARYLGLSVADHVHELKILGHGDLESFNGFSGSPVFVVRGNEAHFAGMVVLGSHDTTKSVRMHFVAGAVLQAALSIVDSSSSTLTDAIQNERGHT